jgi:hypothetical protein
MPRKTGRKASKLPDQDHSGAFVLTQKDLPKGSR